MRRTSLKRHQKEHQKPVNIESQKKMKKKKMKERKEFCVIKTAQKLRFLIWINSQTETGETERNCTKEADKLCATTRKDALINGRTGSHARMSVLSLIHI